MSYNLEELSKYKCAGKLRIQRVIKVRCYQAVSMKNNKWQLN